MAFISLISGYTSG